MTMDEFVALIELVHNFDVTIKPADKGSAVVVMDTSKYIAEAMIQLIDGDVYRLLSCDPKWYFSKKIQLIVDCGFNDVLIDSSLKDFLIIKYTKVPALYLLPKIHKSLINSPGRPIVSGKDKQEIAKFLFSWIGY